MVVSVEFCVSGGDDEDECPVAVGGDTGGDTVVAHRRGGCSVTIVAATVDPTVA